VPTTLAGRAEKPKAQFFSDRIQFSPSIREQEFMMISRSRKASQKWMLRLMAAIAGVGLPVLFGIAGPPAVNGPFSFDPIAESVEPGTLPFNVPWVIPEGFEQAIVSDETDLDIYDGVNLFPDQVDLNDMNTANETGKSAGQYLYRTHEVRPGALGNGRDGGAVSVVDIASGAAKILVQRDDWEALDGIEWTPWGTLLFAEETITALRPDPDFPAAESGLLYEVFFDPQDPTTAVDLQVRPAVGSLSHEGIAVGPDGSVYVIDELAGGGIYRFVPDEHGDLSEGQLSVLVVDDASRTGPAEWVPLDRDGVKINARVEAAAVPNTGWGRPEDLELIGNKLYCAVTSEDLVLCIDLAGPGPFVTNFIEAGVNAPVEGPSGWGDDTGFDSPDNLASSPNGDLIIVEDNVPSDIWFAGKDQDHDGVADEVFLFASLADEDAEGTGIYFGHDPKVLFVNVQHSASGNDKTMAIFKVNGKGKGKGKNK
jgi:hypothetical protein